MTPQSLRERKLVSKIETLVRREFLRGYICSKKRNNTVESLFKTYENYRKDNPTVSDDILAIIK